jgi:hypothetical protein
MVSFPRGQLFFAAVTAASEHARSYANVRSQKPVIWRSYTVQY